MARHKLLLNRRAREVSDVETLINYIINCIKLDLSRNHFQNVNMNQKALAALPNQSKPHSSHTLPKSPRPPLPSLPAQIALESHLQKQKAQVFKRDKKSLYQ